MVSNNWVVSTSNRGHACWATDTGGIPGKMPIWQHLKCAKYGAGWEFCANDSQVFINSADLLAVSIDIVTGERLWETVFPAESASTIAINDKEVCIPPYILSQENGDVIMDLSRQGLTFDLVGDVESNAFYIAINGDWKGILRYQNTRSEYLTIEIREVSVTENGQSLLGYNKESLFLFSVFESKKKWSLPSPVGIDGKPNSDTMNYLVINHMVYQRMYHDSLRCINLVDGRVIWQSGPLHVDDVEPNQYRSSPGKFLGCVDALYICLEIEDNGFIQARSTEDGSKLWSIDAPQARAFLIAGDLLFGALLDVPVAWDRYTGEVVWRAEKGMTAIFHAVAASNKIVYTNTMSQMRCYEWTEPYHSPVRK